MRISRNLLALLRLANSWAVLVMVRYPNGFLSLFTEIVHCPDRNQLINTITGRYKDLASAAHSALVPCSLVSSHLKCVTQSPPSRTNVPISRPLFD
jgi:hypothetical protein